MHVALSSEAFRVRMFRAQDACHLQPKHEFHACSAPESAHMQVTWQVCIWTGVGLHQRSLAPFLNVNSAQTRQLNASHAGVTRSHHTLPCCTCKKCEPLHFVPCQWPLLGVQRAQERFHAPETLPRQLPPKPGPHCSHGSAYDANHVHDAGSWTQQTTPLRQAKWIQCTARRRVDGCAASFHPCFSSRHCSANEGERGVVATSSRQGVCTVVGWFLRLASSRVQEILIILSSLDNGLKQRGRPQVDVVHMAN